MKKIFIENLKGYMEVYNHVERVVITKIDGRKNYLVVFFTTKSRQEFIPLNEIRMCYLININTMEEYFRYSK
jgi:hypothetical protein